MKHKFYNSACTCYRITNGYMGYFMSHKYVTREIKKMKRLGGTVFET